MIAFFLQKCFLYSVPPPKTLCLSCGKVDPTYAGEGIGSPAKIKITNWLEATKILKSDLILVVRDHRSLRVPRKSFDKLHSLEAVTAISCCKLCRRMQREVHILRRPSKRSIVCSTKHGKVNASAPSEKLRPGKLIFQSFVNLNFQK